MRVRPAERQCSRARGKAGSGSSTKSQTANAFARPRTGAQNDVCGNLAAQRKNLAHRSCMPARKNSFAYSALRGRARFATLSTRQRSAPAAERKRKERWEGIVHAVKLCVQRERPKASLPALFQAALVCPQRAPTKGVRRQQKGRKEAEQAGPHSFAHSGHQPKECASSRKEEKRPAVTELQR